MCLLLTLHNIDNYVVFFWYASSPQSVSIDSCVLWHDSGFLQQVRIETVILAFNSDCVISSAVL